MNWTDSLSNSKGLLLPSAGTHYCLETSSSLLTFGFNQCSSLNVHPIFLGDVCSKLATTSWMLPHHLMAPNVFPTLCTLLLAKLAMVRALNH